MEESGTKLHISLVLKHFVLFPQKLSECGRVSLFLSEASEVQIYKKASLWKQFGSPYGELMLGSLGDKLCLCDWVSEKRKEKIGRRMRNTLHAVYEEGTSEVISTAIIQLDEYFARKRTAFDMPLLLAGTDFQKTVWQELLNIPYGKTVSYGELSRKLGNPKAVRAVAAANGANALSIFIPCHRVVGSNRQLIGYAGGLAAKQGLLALEADSCDGLPNSRVVQLF